MRRSKLLAGLACATLGGALVSHADTDEAGGPARLTAEEQKLAARVSGAIFATQAAERAEVASLDLEGLEADLRELRREVEALQLAEARAEVVSGLSGAGGAAGGDRSAAQRSRMNASLSRLAARRAALEAKLPALTSEGQRRLARRGVQKLADLDREVRDAAAAPAGERSRRLAGVKDRLVLESFGPLSLPPATGAPSPTFQMLPDHPLPLEAEE
jgi:hypothetical protein